MTDIGPFRSKDYLGNLELQGMFVTMSKQLRLQRLKEVRESERQIALKRCATYRQCIDGRKLEKAHVIRDQIKSDKLSNLHVMKMEAKKASDESGLAHQLARSRAEVAARETVENAKVAKRRAREDKERQRFAGKIRQEELLAAQRPALRQFALQQVRKEIRQSEREDAHAIGETYAARQQILEAQRAALDSMHAVPPVYTHRRVQQGAVSIEQRFPIEVHARIIRHGARGGKDRSVVHNGAFVEESAILRKNWQAVMREMTTRLRVKARAKVAEQTVERKKGVQFLDSELQQLETADKSYGRLGRLNSAQAVPPDAESPRLQGAFEKVFLNKPVRLGAQQAVYRTGTRLSQAALEKGGHWMPNGPEWESSPLQRNRQTPERNPGWASSTTEPMQSLLHVGASNCHLGRAPGSSSSSSCGGSVAAYSEEGDLAEVRTRRVSEDFYREAGFPAAAGNVPSPTAPKFTVRQGPSSPESVTAAHPGSPDHIGAHAPHHHGASATGAESYQALQPRALSGLQVRVPQVSAPPICGEASPNLHSHGSVSPQSFSSGSSTAKSVNHSPEHSENTEEGPLSIDIRRARELGALEGCVTPPRHSSSRPNGRRTGMIDPFTPPEIHEPRLAVKASPAPDRLDIAPSPASFASSSNTEQARHDRTLPPFTSARSDTGPCHVLADSSCLHSSDVGSGSMTSSTSSAINVTDTFKGMAERKQGVSNSSSPDSLVGTHPPAASSSVAQRFRISLGSSTSGGSGASSSAGSVYSSGSCSPRASVENMGSWSPPQQTGTSSAAASRLTSPASSVSGRGSHLQSASTASTSSSHPARSTAESSCTSSSSSSMLSYLQASPFAVTRAEVVPSGGPAAFALGAGPASPPAHRQRPEHDLSHDTPVSATQSAESDSISALSGGTADMRLSTHSYGLNREQVQAALQDSGSVDSEHTSPSISLRNVTVVSHSPPYTDMSARDRESGQEGSPYDAMYDSWGDDQFISVRVGPQVTYPGGQAAARMPPVREGSLDDSDDDVAWKVTATAGTDAASEAALHRSGMAAGPVRMVMSHERLEVTHSSDVRGSDSGESDERSQRSQGTDDLLEKWTELYEGSLSLGDRARTACSAHLLSYAAAAGPSGRPDETSFFSELSSPAVRPPPPTAHTRIDTVPASPLDAFASPFLGGRAPVVFHSPGRSTSQPSDEERSMSCVRSVSSGTESPDPARESYDFSHAERVIGALDELSANWESRHDSSHAAATEVQAGDSMTSCVVQPPPVPTADLNTQRSNTARNSYAGRLVIHREQRPVARSSLAAQLGLDESLLDTSSEEEGAADRAPTVGHAPFSSDDEQDDASLEELLRGPFRSENAANVLRSELSGLVERLRGHAETAPAVLAPSPPPVAPAVAAAQVLSSGEDTYSSGRYYSAGEARNTSSSTMHTAESGERASVHALRTVETQRSIVSTRLNIHTASRVPSVVERISRPLPGSPPSPCASREAVGTGVSGGSSQSEGERIHRSALDITPSSDGFCSPSTFSGSRLSEYALLSQHTLSATRLGSPGSLLTESPMQTFPRPHPQLGSDRRTSELARQGLHHK